LPAVRAFVKDYWSMWEDHHHHVEEIVDLGNGVGYAVVREDGRMRGSAGRVQSRNAWVSVWVDGRIVRTATFSDIDEGRAVAERLTEERGQLVSEESTASDLTELLRRGVEAASRGDNDALLALYSPDAVWDMSQVGMGVFVGRGAIRGFFEEWQGAYEDYEIAVEESHDLGGGVLFTVSVQKGRPLGSDGVVHLRQAWVTLVKDSVVTHLTTYQNIDEARAAAERLAGERR
jgi:ketosteroid isomerase-like protein